MHVLPRLLVSSVCTHRHPCTLATSNGRTSGKTQAQSHSRAVTSFQDLCSPRRLPPVCRPTTKGTGRTTPDHAGQTCTSPSCTTTLMHTACAVSASSAAELRVHPLHRVSPNTLETGLRTPDSGHRTPDTRKYAQRDRDDHKPLSSDVCQDRPDVTSNELLTRNVKQESFLYN